MDKWAKAHSPDILSHGYHLKLLWLPPPPVIKAAEMSSVGCQQQQDSSHKWKELLPSSWPGSPNMGCVFSRQIPYKGLPMSPHAFLLLTGTLWIPSMCHKGITFHIFSFHRYSLLKLICSRTSGGTEPALPTCIFKSLFTSLGKYVFGSPVLNTAKVLCQGWGWG